MKALVPSLLFLAVAASVNVQAATPANTLVIAQSIDDVVSFDPAQGFELTTVQSFNSLYQRLIQSDPHNPIDLKPTLASSWQAGADDRSLTFSLRPDARFASGNPLRPEDVIFSLSRVVKLNLEPSFILTQLGWNAKNVEQHLSKVDEHTVKISWSENVSPAFVLSLLSAPVSSIVDAKEALAHQQGDDLGHQWLNSHSAGSGPYKIRTYVPHEVVVLDANPGSPEGAPTLKTILIKNVPDPAARWLFDYQGIADDLLKGQFQSHQAFLPDGYLGALKDRPYSFNPQKAKEILAKAGLSNVSFRLDVNNQPPYLDIAQALQASFAQGGVKVELVPGISSQVSTKVKALNYDATLTSWGPDYFDPNTNAAAFAYNPEDGSKTLAWRANWQIPALSKLTLAATAENDTAKRAADYQQLQKQVQQSSPFVIGLQARSLIAVRDNLKGYVQGINPDMVFYSKVSK